MVLLRAGGQTITGTSRALERPTDVEPSGRAEASGRAGKSGVNRLTEEALWPLSPVSTTNLVPDCRSRRAFLVVFNDQDALGHLHTRWCRLRASPGRSAASVDFGSHWRARLVWPPCSRRCASRSAGKAAAALGVAAAIARSKTRDILRAIRSRGPVRSACDVLAVAWRSRPGASRGRV
jgi:hypothetical protein